MNKTATGKVTRFIIFFPIFGSPRSSRFPIRATSGLYFARTVVSTTGNDVRFQPVEYRHNKSPRRRSPCTHDARVIDLSTIRFGRIHQRTSVVFVVFRRADPLAAVSTWRLVNHSKQGWEYVMPDETFKNALEKTLLCS